MKYIGALILLSVVSLWPFFKPGYFSSHDGEWMIVRFSAFHQTLVSGQVPVRFTERLNNNYGYPVLNFLYPLPFYLAEIPKLAGLNFQASIKTTFVLSTVLSAVFMYLALREKYSRIASFTGSVVYLYMPYRMVDLYVRGSLGESVAFMFLPLILLSLFKISKNIPIFFPVLSLSLAGLILSHNVIALFFIPLFAFSTLLIAKNNLKKTAGYFLLGTLMAAFFIIPAINDIKYVRLSQIDVAQAIQHLVPFKRIITSPWQYGPIPSAPDGFSAQIGVAATVVFLLSLRMQTLGKINRNLMLLQIIFLVCVLMMTPISTYLWDLKILNNAVQYPWRLLSVVVFVTAILAAGVVNASPKKNIFAFALIAISIVSSAFYTLPSEFVARDDGYYSTNESTTTIKDEYMPIWAKSNLPRAYQKIIPGNYTINSELIKTNDYSFIATTNEETPLKVATTYYPGFAAKIDGQGVPINYDENGLIEIKLPKGQHEVIIKYGKTSVQQFSEILSLTAFGLIGILFFKEWRKIKSS